MKSRNSVPEVQEYLAKQADLDASNVDAGYSLLRSFIWAIPLLGFIGTVIGISEAVSGLHTSLGDSGPPAAALPADATSVAPPPATNRDSLTAGLSKVTSGLATAFDATLLALVMAILLVFPTEALRKVEYGMLDRIEAFTNESLLHRMAEERTTYDHEKMPEVVRSSLESAFREHRRWLAQWQAQIGQLGQSIGADFEGMLARVETQFNRSETNRIQKMDQVAKLMTEMFAKAEAAAIAWQRSQQGMAGQTQAIEKATAQLQAAIAESGRRLRELVQHAAAQPNSAADLQHSLGEIASQLGRFVQWLDRAAPGGDGHDVIPEAVMPVDLDVTKPFIPAAARGDAANAPRRPSRGILGRLFQRKD